MPRVEAWFVVGPDRLVEEKHDKLLAHAVEVMSPVPHDAALSLVDAFEFLVGWLNGRPEVIPAGFPWREFPSS